MSKTIEAPIVILNQAAADIAAANATWHSVDGADQVIFEISVTGTANATLDFDLMNSNSVSSNNTFTASNSYVLDDPAGQVRAWSDGVGANEAAVIKMRRVFFNQR